MTEISDGPLRKRAALYLELAAQAERNAQEAGSSQQDRAAYLRLSKQWQALAADAQRSTKQED